LRAKFTEPGKVPDYLFKSISNNGSPHKRRPDAIELSEKNHYQEKQKDDSPKGFKRGTSYSRKTLKEIIVKRESNFGCVSNKTRKNSIDSGQKKTNKTINDGRKTEHISDSENDENNKSTENNKEFPSNPSKILDTQKEAHNKNYEGTQFKHCKYCKCHKPPRANHCNICQRCVLRFDHHSDLLGICIGFYNYKYYILGLLYTVILLGISCSDILDFCLKEYEKVFF